ncbi:MAG: S-layer homology domain-containing protein, partial [Clostridia bacterium]|nr:S-layer homology domain-containing protein [Clostridia bacterium]
TDGHWGEAAIEFVVDAGLMNGVGDGTSFAPNMNLTRGMVVTVLYRDNGSPKQDFKGTFLDVADGQYYTAASEWAYANGIVNGTGFDDWGVPYFSPDRDITRQELATMFKRYADFKYVDTTVGAADIASFPDSASVADWATDAVKWAVGVGLITGKGGGGAATLSPTDKAMRAEFATIIKRFKEADFEYKLVYNSPVVQSTYTEKPYAKVENADIYVSVDGSDSNPGTIDKPLATFTAANAKVEELKKTAKDEIVVAFKAGNYGELNYIGIASGTEKVPVKYCAYGDGEVIFSNGIEIKLDEFVPTDEGDLELLGDVNNKNIMKVDLSGRFDSFTGRARLFSNYGICYEARFPNKNANGNVYYTNLTTTYDERSSILVKGALPKIIASFKNIDNMKVSGYLRTGWLMDTFPVKSYDPETNILTFDFEKATFDNGFDLDSYPLMFEGRTDDMVYFHNLPDQLDADGEYYFDEETKVLYVYNPTSDHAIAVGGGMIRADGDYLSFVGLTFMGATDTAMGINGDHNTIDRCTFKYISGNQCIMSFRANYFTVENSEFSNFACGGVVSQGGGSMVYLTESHNVIRNNYFHDFGAPEFFSGSGAIGVQNSVGTVVEHNLLVDGAHGGIVFNGTIKTVIRYNILDNMVNNSQDYGAVYGGGQALRGNQICYNLIMNMTWNKPIYGVYIDECGAGQEVFGNIFYNAGAHAVTLNGGRENNIHDNICINTEDYGGDLLISNEGMYSLILDGTPELYVNHQTYSLLVADRAPLDSPGYEIWYATFPEIYDFNVDPEKVGDPDCLFTTINFLRNNLIIGSDMKFGETFEKFGVNEGNEVYSLDVNDWFVDPTHGDYTFKDGFSFGGIDQSLFGRQ